MLFNYHSSFFVGISLCKDRIALCQWATSSLYYPIDILSIATHKAGEGLIGTLLYYPMFFCQHCDARIESELHTLSKPHY